jgi:hypothetical protein
MAKRSVLADIRDAFGSSLVGTYFAGLPLIREVARRRRPG